MEFRFTDSFELDGAIDDDYDDEGGGGGGGGGDDDDDDEEEEGALIITHAIIWHLIRVVCS
jgi:hypothetical protein